MSELKRLPDADTRTLLQRIAARLTAERPQRPMRASLREAPVFAARRHGDGTSRATRTEALLLSHAPAVEPGTTHLQYAAELRQTEGGNQ
ncbi:hypothetical protein ABT237_19105 [Streptomyces sp. NPDC001581]|uniref:hypothetical protein n=1 Tax=Streptomyces sp. NPDC001581 TaxID=3154386 RepID=UPI00331E3ABE